MAFPNPSGDDYRDGDGGPPLARGTPYGRKPRGFAQAGSLVGDRLQIASERRGFALSRLLVRWTEIVGEETARLAKPLKITHGRSSLGGTLVLLVPGAASTLIQMKSEAIRRAVNAAYGYPAIAKVRLTQTAPEGFAEPSLPAEPPPPSPEAEAEARALAEGTNDPQLRAALEELGRNVHSRHRRNPA